MIWLVLLSLSILALVCMYVMPVIMSLVEFGLGMSSMFFDFIRDCLRPKKSKIKIRIQEVESISKFELVLGDRR